MEPVWTIIWMYFLVLFNSISNIASENSTMAPEGTNATSNHTKPIPFSCQWSDLKFPITYGPGIACGVCVLLGGFKLFVGFKYQRTTLFLIGFTSASILTYFICLERSSLRIEYLLLITAAVGIFTGILCTTVVFCGLFVAGLSAGISVAMAFLLGFATLYKEYNTISIPLGVVISLAVITAGAAVWWKRVFLILSSSVLGSILIVAGIDYFIEDFLLMIYTWNKVFLLEVVDTPCMFSWIILGGWPLLTLIGLLVQFLKTGKAKPKPKKELYNKRYHMGSPFYSAPDLDDIEMTELLQRQAVSHESNRSSRDTQLNADQIL